MTTATIQAEILTDRTARGKERPWRAHKVANEYLAMAYDDVNEKKAERLRSCAPVLHFAVDDEGRKRLTHANFCRVRLCPMCTWRRSLKVYGQVRDVMELIGQSDEPLQYAMLTLTLKNCERDKLSETIDLMMEGWHKLSRQTPFKRAVKGWYRAMEIKHNVNTLSENYDTYHPHFHCLLGVKSTYFSGREYINQAEWTSMWMKAARLDYTPIVHIKRVRGTTAGAVAECAKYAVKYDDILLPDDWELTVDPVRILDAALERRRLVAFGGRFDEARKILKLDDAEDGDLVRTDSREDTGGPEVLTYCYAWYSGYRQYRLQPM
jgi:plasmid rolling circle replication initiator protein Rep